MQFLYKGRASRENFPGKKIQVTQNYVTEEVALKSTWVNNELYHNTCTGEYKKPIQVQVSIGDKIMQAELDSGASRSVIPRKLYNQYLKDYVIGNSETILKLYDGSTIAPEGQIQVDIAVGDKKAKGQLLVVKSGCKMLLGRDMMEALGFKIVQVNSVEVNDELQKVIKQHQALFDGTLGKYKHEKIDLKIIDEVKPVFCKPRVVPFAFKKKISEQLDEIEQKGMLTKVKSCPWGTPLVPIPKKDGGLRLCADYKITVNKWLVDVPYPTPTIEEIFAGLSGGKKFTKLDLSAAYNQLELSENSKKLLAWSTHKGIYLVNRLTYGSKPAAAELDKVLDKVIRGAKGAVNFRDDIVVTGKDDLEHLANLEEVLSRLEEAGLKLNIDKCEFFKDEIRYLGHIINKDGLFKDPEKVAAMLEAKVPANTSEVKSFTGMVNYYGRFIPKLADMMSPLYDVQNKEKFHWTKQAEQAFKAVKEELASERNLIHFNPELKIKLVCDASSYGIGGILMHVTREGQEKPIAYASRVLRKAEKNYSVLDKEALAIYWSVRKFYQYLAGQKFVIGTDHRPLTTIFGERKGLPQMASGRLQRWAVYLSGFNYTIEHIKGVNNTAADGLSRLPRQIADDQEEDLGDYFNFMTAENLPIRAENIIKHVRRDPLLSRVYMYVKEGWPTQVQEELKPFAQRAEEIYIEKDMIMWGYRLVIPECFKQQLLQEIHGGHIGISKMKALARQYFWWPKLDQDIEEFVKNCKACQLTSSSPEKVELKKFPEAKFPFERVHIDFLGPYKGRMYLILVDAFSRWPEIVDMGNKTDSKFTIEKLREIFARYGLPGTLISDNGPQLVSEEFETFCKLNGIKHTTSPPYHPATNGLAENGVKSFKKGLDKALNDNQKEENVQTLISKYLFAYRNAPHLTTGESPAIRFLGRKMRSRLDLLRQSLSEEAIDRQVKYFRGNRDVKFEEGEKVLVRDYKNPMKPGWETDKIDKVLGERIYICTPDSDTALSWKRHADQLLLKS